MASQEQKVLIGRRIEQARLEAGLLQRELAELLGVSERSISAYERGEVVPYRHMEKLVEIVGRSVDWFLHGDPEIAPDLAEVLAQIQTDVLELKALVRGVLPLLEEVSRKLV